MRISGCIPSKTPADYEPLVSLKRSVASIFEPRAVAVEAEKTPYTQRSPMTVSKMNSSGNFCRIDFDTALKGKEVFA